jgi:hypothetical protein
VVLLLTSGPAAVAAPPTFTRDVAPILYARCVRCHRPGEIGPMALTTYKQARPYAKAIRDEILARTMPPWKADPQFGQFANDDRLTEAEVATLVRWVEGGATEGPAAALPPLPRFVDGWNIGKPDLEIALPQPVAVPRSGTLDNQYFTVPTGLTEDRWVSAIEIRPGNRRVLHHATVFLVGGGGDDGPPGVPCRDAKWAEQVIARARERARRGGLFAREYLYSWTPGSSPFAAPPGGARRIPAGAQIVFEMHYAPNGQATEDRTRIGLVFQRAPVVARVRTVTVTQQALEIPPGEPNYAASACYYFARPEQLLALKPHMHLRGRDMRFTVAWPDGRREVVLFVPRWDFDWQLTYVLRKPLALEPGARVEIEAHFDNSAKNPRNPDPTRTVVWDELSTGEMLAGMLTLAEDRPAAKQP